MAVRPTLLSVRPGIHLSSRSWVHLLVQPTTASPWTPQPFHPPTCPAPLCSSHTAGLTLEHRGAADNPSKAGRQVRPSHHGLLLQHRLGPPSPSCYEPAPQAESHRSPPRPAWTPRFSVHSRVVLSSPVCLNAFPLSTVGEAKSPRAEDPLCAGPLQLPFVSTCDAARVSVSLRTARWPGRAWWHWLELTPHPTPHPPEAQNRARGVLA